MAKIKFIYFFVLGIFLVPQSFVTASGTVGDGTPASCTEAALATAVSGGGLVTFACGPNPHTIVLTTEIPVTSDTEIDGNTLVTLDGNLQTRILHGHSGVTLTVRNLTFIDGYTTAEGGAIYIDELSHLTVENSSFSGHVSTQTAELYAGGGAISIERRSSATILNSTFSHNQAGNGGAIAIGGWNGYDQGGTITVQDSIFTHNSATEDGSVPGGGDGGGAIYLKGGVSATIRNSTFTANQAPNGGAIHQLHADVLIENSTFADNIANHAYALGGGGALYMDGGKLLAHESMIIRHSTFRNNSTNNAGGAIFSFPEGSETTVIEDSLFEENRAHGRGLAGAIYHQSAAGKGHLEIDRTAFIRNDAFATFPGGDFASQGGAIWLINTTAAIQNSTFYANDASDLSLPATDWHRGFGGAIVAHAVVDITNSTFAYNTAGFVGGAIAPANTDVVTVRNTILAHNSGANLWGNQPNCTQALVDAGGNMQYPNGNCFTGQVADPLLGSLGLYGGNTPVLPLMAGSPAIDNGTDVGCPIVDQRGMGRVGVCDVGAYESGNGPTMTALSPSLGGVNLAQDFVLTIYGGEFTAETVVRWGGAARPTTFIDSSQLTADISAADLADSGTVMVTVYDPNTAVESNALQFTIVETLYKAYLPTTFQ